MSDRGFQRGGRGGRPAPRGRGTQGRGGVRGGRGRGGARNDRQPAEVFAGDVPAVLDDRLTQPELDSLVGQLQKMQIGAGEMPLRPGWGTVGQNTTLRANFFMLRLPKDLKIYDYEVKIRPKDAEGQGKGEAKAKDGAEGKLNGSRKARIFGLLERSPECQPYMNHIVHDRAAHLVSSEPLPQPLVVSVQYYEEDDYDERGDPITQGEYLVEIKLNDDIDISTRDITQYVQGQNRQYNVLPLVSALNLVLQKHAQQSGAVRVGNNKLFFPEAERFRLVPGLEARRGYFMSVRPTYNTLMLNVNTAWAAFYDFSGNLAEAMISLERRLRSIPDKFFDGIKVTTKHLGYRRPYKILSIERPANRVSFECQELGGMVTVQQYFAQKYKVILRHAEDLPVLKVGKPGRAVYLPAEICEVPPNQSYKNALDGRATAAMVRVACNAPAKNASLITTEGLPLLGLLANPARNSTLGQFGLSVKQEMAVIPARILPSPRVQYSTGNPNFKDGGWNLVKTRFQKGADFKNWAVLLVQGGGEYEFGGPDDPALEHFLTRFAETCRSCGMTVTQQSMIMEASTSVMRDVLSTRLDLRSKESKPTFILVLLPSDDRRLYAELKTLCDVELGIQTVCQALSVARDQKVMARIEQYFANDALKINTKLGGTNHSLDPASMDQLKTDSTMFVGIDVTHPSPGSIKGAPSIAAVVASADRNSLSQFPVSLRLQGNENILKDAEEMVQDLTSMMVERLTFYKRNAGAYPLRVIVYRDGVSEGQYNLVLKKELPQIRGAFNQLQIKPKLTTIVCGKRHHARFFATSADCMTNNGNTLPGTVVDKGVTDVYNSDFYLQAHNGLKGTVRPTHYIVVHDENGFTADQVQMAVHSTSYAYVRATKAVSLAPPAYYADLACERARLYLNSILAVMAADTHSVRSKGEGRSGEEAERARVYKRAEELWGNGVHEHIKDTMFYI